MAEMHTPYSSLKKLLFFLNGLVAMSGVLLIGLGTWVNGGPTLTRVLGLSSAYLLHIGYLCLAMGCITVLLGFAGWYGATKENRGILLFVQDMAFEHILMTLRKNYRGYNEPDDYPGCFLKLMRITRIQSFTLSGGSLGAVAIKLPGILTTLLLFAKLG
nr:tetraspanin-16 [Loxodonta africana]